MSLILTAAGLVASGIGAGIKAYKNTQAEKLAEQNYNAQRTSLLSDLYSNPLDSISNKAILSQMYRRIRKNNEAVENMATAGGATFENTLAAKQASNDAMENIASGMMQNDQVRKDATKQQLLNLDSKRTAKRIDSARRTGEGWASMGNKAFDSFTSLGGLMLENDYALKDLLKWQ